MTPARVPARRVPVGQDPYFLLQEKRPILSAKRKIITLVNMYSSCVGCGRGGLGRRIHKPSCHVKNSPKKSPARMNAIQKFFERRNAIFMMRIMPRDLDSYQDSFLSGNLQLHCIHILDCSYIVPYLGSLRLHLMLLLLQLFRGGSPGHNRSQCRR